jgi:hypothetical protein
MSTELDLNVSVSFKPNGMKLFSVFDWWWKVAVAQWQSTQLFILRLRAEKRRKNDNSNNVFLEKT